MIPASVRRYRKIKVLTDEQLDEAAKAGNPLWEYFVSTPWVRGWESYIYVRVVLEPGGPWPERGYNGPPDD